MEIRTHLCSRGGLRGSDDAHVWCLIEDRDGRTRVEYRWHRPLATRSEARLGKRCYGVAEFLAREGDEPAKLRLRALLEADAGRARGLPVRCRPLPRWRQRP